MKLGIELYKKMFLIRKSEEMIQKYYFDDKMKTPMHMSMGSEALVVAVCHSLSDEDQIIGTYRSHAGYLAKTNNSDNFFAELYGKDIALVKGKGGSMHLMDPQNGHMGSSAVVASSLPAATGLAFANKYLNNEKEKSCASSSYSNPHITHQTSIAALTCFQVWKLVLMGWSPDHTLCTPHASYLIIYG